MPYFSAFSFNLLMFLLVSFKKYILDPFTAYVIIIELLCFPFYICLLIFSSIISTLHNTRLIYYPSVLILTFKKY